MLLGRNAFLRQFFVYFEMCQSKQGLVVTLPERRICDALKSLQRSHSTSCTSLLANRSCPWIAHHHRCYCEEMIHLLLTLDCLQLQQSRLSSIPESRDLWLRNQISDQNSQNIKSAQIRRLTSCHMTEREQDTPRRLSWAFDASLGAACWLPAW